LSSGEKVCPVQSGTTAGGERSGPADRILTGGDITRGLLGAISLDYHAEEISRYRAKHIFEDIASDQTSLILRYKVEPKDFRREATRPAKSNGPWTGWEYPE